MNIHHKMMLNVLLSIGTLFLVQGPTGGLVSMELGVSANHLCTVSDVQFDRTLYNETCLLKVPGDGSWILQTESESNLFRCGVTCVLLDDRDGVAYHPERVLSVLGSPSTVKKSPNTVFALMGAAQIDDGCAATVREGTVLFEGTCNWYVYDGAKSAYTDFEPKSTGGDHYDMNAWSALPIMTGFTHTSRRQYTLNDTSTRAQPWAIRFHHCPRGCLHDGLCVAEDQCLCADMYGGSQCQCYGDSLLPEPGYCNMTTAGVHACECDTDCPSTVQCVSIAVSDGGPVPVPVTTTTKSGCVIWMLLFFILFGFTVLTNAWMYVKYKMLKQRHEPVIDSRSIEDHVYAQFP